MISCMYHEQCGKILNLPIVDGEPKLELAEVIRRRKLGRTKQKTLASSPNFRLKVAQMRLIETLDEIRNGVLTEIKFRDGVPCELELSKT